MKSWTLFWRSCEQWTISAALISVKSQKWIFPGWSIYDLAKEEYASIRLKGEPVYVSYFHGRNYCAGPNGFCYWDNEKRLCIVDMEGWVNCIAEKGEIKSKDYSPLPTNVWEIYVNNKYSCTLYDGSLKTIELMVPN